MSLAEKLFGSFSDRELKKINPITKKVLALETKYQPMSDAELQAQTPALKERLANGETLDDILPDAFAVCREAAWRVLGMKHFPVQIMGGIALHRGSIAEMQTGEGKTLVATLPAYLNALTGEGVHIVTVNDYLAKRDSEWMGKLYRWLGLNVGLIVQGIDGGQVFVLRPVLRGDRALLVEFAQVVQVVDAVADVVDALVPLVGGRQPDDGDAQVRDRLRVLGEVAPVAGVRGHVPGEGLQDQGARLGLGRGQGRFRRLIHPHMVAGCRALGVLVRQTVAS